MNEEGTISFKVAAVAGHWVITPKLNWQLTETPNWRTRFFARWLLGWRWVSR